MFKLLLPLLMLGSVVLFFVLAVLNIELDWIGKLKNKKEMKKVVSKNVGIVEKYYTREDKLIEAHQLIKFHGAWTYKTATDAINQRMTLVRQTLHPIDKNWEWKCPVCQKSNTGFRYTGETLFCECPASSRIKKIYAEARRGQ